MRMLLLFAALVLGMTAVPAVALPEIVPDRVPVASAPVARGALVRTPAADVTPTTKVVDGLVNDWVGEASSIGGQSRLDAGEHIHTDYLFDDFGADDGGDAARLALLDPLSAAEPRLGRLDALQQAAGDQFGAGPPLGALDHYGDTELAEAADLAEVRWAADADQLYLLARTTTLTDPDLLGIVVLAGNGTMTGPARPVGFGTGLTSATFATAVRLTSAGATMRDLASGNETALPIPLAVNAGGWTNALEAALPAELLPPDGTLRVAVVAGVRAPSAAGAGEDLVPVNVAYRPTEPVTIYNERLQALALHAGSVDQFSAEIDVAALRGGASETVVPGPGYHERQFLSGENISHEQGEHGLRQPYGLFIPTSHDPATATALTYWLHYRGGKAHSGAAWTPRLVTQLGEEVGNVVVTPRGRGTSTWYVTKAHQDFFEVFADVEGLLDVDPARRYLSGYSMGGYGTYLFGLLYPDLFAAGYSTAGAVTQGAWTGLGPDDGTCASQACFVEANGGDADAQLTYRVLENARHLPLVIHHGSTDELVPITGVQRMGARLAELGYRYDLTTFIGYEHFTQAILDEWADGASYLARFRAPTAPRQVTYKVVPAMVEAVNTVNAEGVAFDFKPDGAYWVDDIVVRAGELSAPTTSGQVDATSYAVETPLSLPVPHTGVLSPVDHSTPYVRHGLDRVDLPLDHPVANTLEVTLRNVASATLDAGATGLDLDGLLVTVSSDGPAELTITAGSEQRTVTVTGGTQTVTL